MATADSLYFLLERGALHPISTISLARQGAQGLMVMVMVFNHGREEEPLSSGEVNATSQSTMVPSLTSPVFNGFYRLPDMKQDARYEGRGDIRLPKTGAPA